MNIENELNLIGMSAEDYEEFLQMCSDKINGIIDIDWQDIIDKFNLPFDRRRVSESMARNILGSNFVRDYYLYKNQTFNEATAIRKERLKLQTEKTEYSRWQREQARDELITEKICDAIERLPVLDIPEFLPYNKDDKSQEYLLPITDAHYGIEFDLHDLDGNVINSYSPEIFEQRMWKLRDEIVKIIQKKQIKHLHIWELGDSIQGILRLNSQLMKLRYGIIDSSIRYANFIAEWLNDLSRYTVINFQMVVDSNHNQIRICNAPKNAFPEENMSKVMLVLIKERLKNNPNITITENQSGYAFGSLCDYNILGVHGETKNGNNDINNLSRVFNKRIDFMVGGHVHHKVSEELQTDCEVISVRSIIGTDPYGLSLYKTAKAGATLLKFTEGKGLTEEYHIKLN